jgi:predicted  nucleic acid-binding Zn-ribbon protein
VRVGISGSVKRAGDEAAGAEQQIRQLEKGISSLRARIEEHRAKLEAYLRDPDAFDHKGMLSNAGTPEIRERIIKGRVEKLQREIDSFVREIVRKQDLINVLRRERNE